MKVERFKMLLAYIISNRLSATFTEQLRDRIDFENLPQKVKMSYNSGGSAV
jgi:hypothetical protein